MSHQATKRSPQVSTAISALLVQQPFFASLLLDLMDVVETDTIPATGENLKTIATNGKTLWINPVGFAKFSVPEQIGLLAHEVMHVILQHAKRQHQYELLGLGPDLKEFSKKKFNHATDYIINAYLTKQGFKLPLGSLQNSQVGADDIVDEVYLKLPDDEAVKDDGPDQHESSDPNTEYHKSSVQAAVKKAHEVAKMQGKGTAGLERLIDDICEPQVPWHEHLRKAITTTVRGRDVYTWSRPNRRKLAIAPHVYWPGKSGLKGPNIAIEIDTSGSIGESELKTFLGETSGILADIQPEMVYVAYVDDKLCGDIIQIDDVNDLQALGRKAAGGGGTDMTQIFDIIEQQQIPAEAVIIFTDGYTGFGTPSDIPTIWCITNENITAPWGVTVHVKIPTGS
jgi:predicted metal-dependent peptidase